MNTIVNYDRAIIAYLTLPFGTELERIKNSDEYQTYGQNKIDNQSCTDGFTID